MEPIQDFAGLICRLRSLKERKRVVVVCPNDPHTEYVITRSLHEGFADFLLVADTPHLLNSEYIRLQYPDHVKVYEATSPDKAAQEAVSLIREGHADVLMKGIINTDNLLRAVLNKEHGILPKGNVLSHITVAQIPMYKKLLFFSDAAVIPRPTLEQFEAMLRYKQAKRFCCMKTRKKERCRTETFTVSVRHLFHKSTKCANDPCHPQMAGAVCVIVWGAHAPWYHKAASGSIIMRRFRASGSPRRSR